MNDRCTVPDNGPSPADPSDRVVGRCGCSWQASFHANFLLNSMTSGSHEKGRTGVQVSYAAPKQNNMATQFGIFISAPPQQKGNTWFPKTITSRRYRSYDAMTLPPPFT
jgi:hypothetical protein